MAKDLTKRETDQTALAVNYGADAGAGFEGVNQDFIALPFLNLLQALSPQVAGTEDQLVDGAKPGKFLNSVTCELYDEVIFQPVHVRRVFVQWVDRADGGGKAGEHVPESAEVVAALKSAKEWNDIRMPNGDSLIETFYLLGLILAGDSPQPALLSLASTKIRPFKRLMTRLSLVRVGGKQPPLFAHQLRLSSVSEANAAGQPFKNIKWEFAIDNNPVSSLLPPDGPEIVLAKQLRAAYLAGTATPAKEDASSAEGKGDDGGLL